MSRSIDYATAGLAKILDPVAQCFTPEVAKRVAELRADPAVQARIEELAYAEGRGPHPATKDNATDFVGVEEDPFQ